MVHCNLGCAVMGERLNLNAYYYSFDPTGVLAIDRVLAAVARAGKGSHHTEDWGESYDGEPSLLEGIQGAADESAKLVSELENCPLRQLAKWAEGNPFWRYTTSVHLNDEWRVSCYDEPDDAYSDDDTGLRALGKGPTILEATADAVRQLKEKGEL